MRCVPSPAEAGIGRRVTRERSSHTMIAMPTFDSRHLLLCFALLAPGVAAAQGQMNEGLWEITLRMEVAGQPATAAPMVVRQCITQQTAQELVAQLTGAGEAVRSAICGRRPTARIGT